jgi:hypothetical protein
MLLQVLVAPRIVTQLKSFGNLHFVLFGFGIIRSLRKLPLYVMIVWLAGQSKYQ